MPVDCVAALVPGPRLDGKSLYRALEEFKCDSSSGVPTVFLNLLDYMATDNKRLHYLKMLRIGGAACPAKIVTKFSRCSLAYMPLTTLFPPSGVQIACLLICLLVAVIQVVFQFPSCALTM